MKKRIVPLLVLLCICLSFFAGTQFARREAAQASQARCSHMLGFAADKLEDIKASYDQDVMEALISNIYAAYEYSGNGALSSALHALWNALIFDGENLAGNEDDLIYALHSADPQRIESLAMRIRTGG